jgi:UDP-glucose 4-epimerase
MRILITGNKGFIGSHLTKTLIKQGHNVSGIDSNINGIVTVDCKNYDFDLRNISILDFNLKRFDVIYHCAAIARVQPSIAYPVKYEDNNVLSTLSLLEECKKQKFSGKFIFFSSSSVYGGATVYSGFETEPCQVHDPLTPTSPYAISKKHCEDWCQYYIENSGLDIYVIRPFSVYGENMATGSYSTVISAFQEQYEKHGKLFITGDGENRRDFTHVEDVVDFCIAMITNGDSRRVFNVCSGKSVSINEIADCFPCEREYIGTAKEDAVTYGDWSNLLGFKPKHNVIQWLKNKIRK